MSEQSRDKQPEEKKSIFDHRQELLNILATYNPSSDSDKYRDRLLGYMLDLTNASGIMVFTLQSTDPPFVERFLFSPDQTTNFLKPVNFHRIDLAPWISPIHGQVIDVQLDQSFQNVLKILAPDLKSQKVYFSPLTIDHNQLGCLLILDPQGYHDELQFLLAMAATVFANAILSQRLIHQFQITIADLEASRWEVLNSRNTLRTLFDNIPLSIYIVNKDYSIAAINRHRASQLDISITRIVGRKCYKVLFNRNNICPGCEINQSLLEGKTTSREHQVWQEGQDHPLIIDVASYPVLNEDKKIVQAIMVENNITERRRLEDSLIQNEKLAAVGQLAAGMAHEINNPLAAIIANAQLIRREAKANKDITESADLIEQAGVRASQTISDLLRFSRQESYTFTETNLNDSIKKVVSLLQFRITRKNAKVILDLQPKIPIINASEDHLQSVWVNLVVNALDAAGETPLEITITTRYANDEFIILFADNGKGIPQDRLSKIFTPFYTTKAPGSGTGLGLSICHRIVTNHGGEIRVESRLGHGTRFIIILPEKYP